MNKVLYITRNGLLEPLGQSQVMPYLRGLSSYYKISLITFEKEKDINDYDRFERLKKECQSLGICWYPQYYRYYPTLIGSTWSMIKFLALCLKVVKKDSIKLIHARSYLPAAIAWIVNKVTKVPFIFDMRALWPEELITSSRINRNSFLHKIIILIERLCLRDASAVVTLTNASVKYLNKKYSKELKNKKLLVIPTCVDLNKFPMVVYEKSQENIPMVHGCIGTVLSGWFDIKWLTIWFNKLAEINQNSTFEIISQDDSKVIRSLVDSENILGERLKINSCLSEDVPNAIINHSISSMFYKGGEVSELGRSPTRLAEVLACGIPVVVNRGVGDVADIVSQNRVGIVLDGIDALSISNAIDNLHSLYLDDEIQRRCRDTAEKIFSLEFGIDNYRKAYNGIIK
jgi:glycosyltransferase involved in cell wall biosynthesis